MKYSSSVLPLRNTRFLEMKVWRKSQKITEHETPVLNQDWVYLDHPYIRHLLLMSSHYKNKSEVTPDPAAKLWVCLVSILYTWEGVQEQIKRLYLHRYSWDSLEPTVDPTYLINAIDLFSFWTLANLLFSYGKELHEPSLCEEPSPFGLYLPPTGIFGFSLWRRQWKINPIHPKNLSCDSQICTTFSFITSFPNEVSTYLLTEAIPSFNYTFYPPPNNFWV